MRHPYDRCISRFYQSRKSEKKYGWPETWDRESIDQFLRYRAGSINENWAFYTSRDELLVDFAVRYERLESDLGAVSERLGLDRNIYDVMKDVHAKGDTRPSGAGVDSVLSEENRRLIATLCHKEMELFGYDSGFDPTEVPTETLIPGD